MLDRVKSWFGMGGQSSTVPELQSPSQFMTPAVMSSESAVRTAAAMSSAPTVSISSKHEAEIRSTSGGGRASQEIINHVTSGGVTLLGSDGKVTGGTVYGLGMSSGYAQKVYEATGGGVPYTSSGVKAVPQGSSSKTASTSSKSEPKKGSADWARSVWKRTYS